MPNTDATIVPLVGAPGVVRPLWISDIYSMLTCDNASWQVVILQISAHPFSSARDQAPSGSTTTATPVGNEIKRAV